MPNSKVALIKISMGSVRYSTTYYKIHDYMDDEHGKET